MSLHYSAFDYLQPSPAQIETMKVLREAAKVYAHILERELPDGPDKTYTLRRLREVAMWANVCVTRDSHGEPRA